MRKMLSRLFAATLALVLSTATAASQQGMLTSGQVIGNGTASTAPPRATSQASIFDQAFCSTQGGVLTRNASTWICLPPGTSGLPLLSAGAAANLAYGILPLSAGGTAANLTASNGGIFYSTGSAGAILSGTATAGQMLRSGASGAPSWSTATFPATATGTGTILRADGTNWVATTATYPTTTTANQLLYSSATNVIGGLTSANTAALITDSSGIPSWLAGGTANRVLRTNGTAVSWAQVALATDVSGQLPVASGGTNCAAASGTCLDNVTGFAATGILARTASGTYAFRTLAGTANEITATNGDGVAGAPTFSLPAALTFSGKTVTGGTYASPTLTTPTIASIINTGTLTLPTSTDTLVGRATTDTFTNKTFDTAGTGNSFSINGLAATANTGTGAVARAASPTFTTPALGAATATTINGITISASTGTLTLNTNTLAVASSGNSLILAGTGGGAQTMTFQGTDTYVGRATTDTLTNKTLTAATANGTTLGQNVLQTGVITPTALSGDVNDYNPSGLATASVVRIDGGAASRNITGLAAQASGTKVTIYNVGSSNNLVLKTESASSSAANRFAIGGSDITLAPGQNAKLWYDGTSSRWRAEATFTVAGGSPAGTVTSVTCGDRSTAGSGAITTSGDCANGTLLETLTASASASLSSSASFSGYNRIQLVFDAVVPATNNVICRLRVNSGGVQSTSYLTSGFIFGTGAGVAPGAETTYIPCSRHDTATLGNTAANAGVNGEWWIHSPNDTTHRKAVRSTTWMHYDTSAAYPITGVSVGHWDGGNGAVSGFEVTMSSGNITSGTIKIYGWK